MTLTLPVGQGPDGEQRRRQRQRVAVDNGALRPNEELKGEYRGQNYFAVVQGDGRIKVESGEVFNAPSPAAMFLMDRQACNGWNFWKIRRGSDETTLKAVRDEALRTGVLEQQQSLV